MTATDDALTKGDEESVKRNESSKPEKAPSADPGSLADRPMGDDPPPKNEELADDVAPTFEVSTCFCLCWTTNKPAEACLLVRELPG